MKSIQRQTFLKCHDGFVILLHLCVQETDEIISIRFVGNDFRNVLKCVDALFRLAKIFVSESEVVPGECILGELLRRRFERGG